MGVSRAGWHEVKQGALCLKPTPLTPIGPHPQSTLICHAPADMQADPAESPCALSPHSPQPSGVQGNLRFPQAVITPAGTSCPRLLPVTQHFVPSLLSACSPWRQNLETYHHVGVSSQERWSAQGLQWPRFPFPCQNRLSWLFLTSLADLGAQTACSHFSIFPHPFSALLTSGPVQLTRTENPAVPSSLFPELLLLLLWLLLKWVNSSLFLATGSHSWKEVSLQ